MPTHEPQNAEQFALTNLMETVEQNIMATLNGAPDAKGPWMFALVAVNGTDQTFAFLSSDKDPRHGAALFMLAAERIMSIDPEDIAEVEKRAKAKKN